MKFYIDTANIDEIRKANELGVICGITTNPSIIAKESRSLKKVVQDINAIIDAPISGEVNPDFVNAIDMIQEGREIAGIHKNMVIKLPTTIEGLKACKVLSQEGIKINMTLIFNVTQALLATRAGAAYVSPFIGRLEDISMDGIQLVKDIVDIFKIYNIETEIICASVRNTTHIIECAKAGASIATVPYKLIEQMIKHPLTDEGIKKFQEDYKTSKA